MEEVAQIDEALKVTSNSCGLGDSRFCVRISFWKLSAWKSALEVCYYLCYVPKCPPWTGRNLEIFPVCLPLHLFNTGRDVWKIPQYQRTVP